MEHQVIIGMPWPGGTRLYETRLSRDDDKIKVGDSLLLHHGEQRYKKKVIDVRHFDSAIDVHKYLEAKEPLSREMTWSFAEIQARYISQVAESGITIIELI